MSVRDTINEWFRTHLASGPLARDTEAYNQVRGALPDLIAQLDPSDVAPVPEPETQPDAAPTPEADKATKGSKSTQTSSAPDEQTQS